LFGIASVTRNTLRSCRRTNASNAPVSRQNAIDGLQIIFVPYRLFAWFAALHAHQI
jgi:hypothetical protein